MLVRSVSGMSSRVSTGGAVVGRRLGEDVDVVVWEWRMPMSWSLSLSRT